MKSYRDLIVWQKSMDLVTKVYIISKCFPNEELYGITSQIRRSAVSIPSNIAERYGRHSTNDYLRFLQISSASLYELQTQLEISNNIGYLPKEDFEQICNLSGEIERMLSTLIRKIGEST